MPAQILFMKTLNSQWKKGHHLNNIDERMFYKLIIKVLNLLKGKQLLPFEIPFLAEC